MQELKLGTSCPHCSKDLMVTTEIPSNPLELAPDVRGKIRPIGFSYTYEISSEFIKKFITKKAQKLVPDVKIDLVPRYCEKKRRRDNEPHRSYASLRIAFSDAALEKKDEDLGWYGKIGEGAGDVHMVRSLFQEIITRYQYKREDIDKWVKSYKTLEELEDALGMTEAYLNDIRMYCTPRRVKTTDKESWILFSAAAENVIADILTEVTSNKISGAMKIKDVYPVSSTVVNWVVEIDPLRTELKENPHVRQILLGEEKPKK